MNESPRLRPARSVDDVGKATGKFLDLLPKADIGPTGFEKKYRVAGGLPRLYFVRVASDGDIPGQNDPAAFAG